MASTDIARAAIVIVEAETAPQATEAPEQAVETLDGRGGCTLNHCGHLREPGKW